VGARSVGARVPGARRLVFVAAAAGCGAAGALLIISQLNVQPASAFSVSWSAQMIFVTIIGGIGTIEGPILGTIIFFVLQQTLSSHGTWYLIILGLVAIAIAIWVRRGVWGLIAERTHIRLFPVGYWLWPESEHPSRPLLPRLPHRPR
jgi:branched-chain amino acid transport system permease protein